MNGDIRKLRRVFVIGSAIPLIAYIFWQLVTLGSIDSSTFIGLMAEHAGLNGFLLALREVVTSPHVELAVHLFADLALATSFRAWRSVCLIIWQICSSVAIPSPAAYRQGDHLPASAGLCPLLPARVCHGAGVCGVALSILALLLPSLLAWKSRQQHARQGYRVAGGKPLLCIVFACGVVIILVQF